MPLNIPAGMPGSNYLALPKPNPGNLYQETEKGKKKMLPNIEELLENRELEITTSLSDKNSIKWRKPGGKNEK